MQRGARANRFILLSAARAMAPSITKMSHKAPLHQHGDALGGERGGALSTMFFFSR